MLEEKRERGEVLDSDQQAKLLRKRDVVIQLEQVEAKKKTLGHWRVSLQVQFAIIHNSQFPLLYLHACIATYA